MWIVDGWVVGRNFCSEMSYDVLVISQQSEGFISFCQDRGLQPVVHKAAGDL